MRLLIYDTEMRSANGYLPRAIATAAEGLLGPGDVRLCDHATVVGLAASGAWDGLLAIGGAGADHHLITALMETPILRILWTTEDPYERRLLERVEPAFHHVFSNELLCDGASPRTTYLPLAAEPSLHHRPLRTHDSDYVYDLTFVGTAWPNRVRSLNRLLQQLPAGLRLHLCLPWNRHIPEPKLPGIGVLPQLRLSMGDLCDIWNRSRVVLTIGREFTAGGSAGAQARGSSPPPRVYETAMAGGFQVALAGAGMDVAAAYGKHIPIAADEAEAAAWVLAHLADPDQRIARAAEHQAHTLAHHTYRHRLTAVLDRFRTLAASQLQPGIAHPSREPAVLHLAHNLVGLGLRRAGGTERYVQEIALQQRRNRPNRRVLALAPKDAIRLALLDYGPDRAQVLETIRLGRVSRLSGSNQMYEQALAQVISSQGIGLVHVHHLIGLPLSLPLVAKALGCRVVLTIHDYHMVCHRYTLLTPDGQFCHIDQQDDPSISCRLCLQASGMQGDERQRRMALTRRSIGAADVILANTTTSAEIVAAVYPEVANRIQVLEMLTPELDGLNRARRKRCRTHHPGPLQVGVIGNAMPHKGLTTLVRVIKASRGLPIELHILGATPELHGALQESGLTASEPPIMSCQGSYGRSELIGLLMQLDAALFLSTWPETYNICLGEAMRLGVVPVATDLGAHRDRVVNGETGILVSANNPLEVIQALLLLQGDRDLHARLSGAAAAVPLQSSISHGDELERIYHRLAPWRGQDQIATPPRLDSQIDLAALGLRLAQNRWGEPGVDWDPAT
ncbi:MAG: glycosyltransferase [Cyanobium sp. M30B3]|nr:MAG: glycosyltransferase [Cyanobium sp. M30B3]